jgi:PKD repeat protein
MFKLKIPFGWSVLACAFVLLFLQPTSAQAQATYTATPTNGTSPLTVQFSGPSTYSGNAITAWAWNFGDGATSTAQNPVHTYLTNATFVPSLTVTYLIILQASATGPSITVGPKYNFLLTPGVMTNARSYATATLLQNGLMLVAGGANTNGVLNTCELYNQATGKWTPTGFLNQSREYHTATLLTNGQVLVVGGVTNGTFLTSAELYDPKTGLWTNTGAMHVSRQMHSANLLADGRVLVAGGTNAGGALNSVEIYDPALRTWTVAANMSKARYAHTTTLLQNGEVLAAGGNNGSGAIFNAEVYNPNTSVWTNTGSMTIPRYSHSATLLASGKVLVAGGDSGGATPKAELYNPTNGTWASTGLMNIAHEGHTATLLFGGNVLVTGGVGASGATAEVYSTGNSSWGLCGVLNATRAGNTATLLANGQVLLAGGNFAGSHFNSSELATVNTNFPGGSWSATGSMTNARSGPVMTLLPNGKVLAAGGTTNSGSSYLVSAEIYDPARNTWATTGPLTLARGQATATLLTNGQVLVAGGLDSAGFGLAGPTELYDPTAGTFTTSRSLISLRENHTSTLLTNGMVMVTGGENSMGAMSSTELYDPQAQTWTNAGPLATPRYSHTATLLTNGLILVAGGYNGSFLASAELYNPVTRLWTNTGPMLTGRYNHTATLLANGQVLVTGGISLTTSGVTNAELYNPVTGLWTATGSMANGRYSHSATLLRNGNVLVTGGFKNSGALATSEIYHPALGTWVSSASLNTARDVHAATLLPSGLILVAGGANTISGDLASAELFDPGFGYPSNAIPAISSVSPLIMPNGTLGLSGTGFRGNSEGSGGNGSGDSATDYPLIQIRSIEGGRTVFLNCSNWLSTSFISTPVTNFPLGYAMVTAFVDGVPSTSAIIDVASPLLLPSIIAGFGTGSGWTLNNGARIQNNTLTLVTNAGQSDSAFYNIPQDINTFVATFTWQNTVPVGGANPANGMVFTVQNQAPTALGSGGTGLGYQGITPASGIAFNLTTASSGVNYAPSFFPTNFQSVSPVNLQSTDPLTVSLDYSNSTLTVAIVDTNSTNVFATNYNVNLTSDAGGSSAYIGFTAASGAGSSYQTISNFVFIPAGGGAPPTGLLVNGGFETGDLTGWTQVGNTLANVTTAFAHSGSYSVQFGGVVTPALLEQNIATTPGATYLLSFWLNNYNGGNLNGIGGYQNEFFALWNGQPLVVNPDMAAFGWTNFQFVVTATGASSTLEFGGVDYSSYLFLDDVDLESEFVQYGVNTSNGVAPLSVQFTAPSTDNLGQNITQWNWDFGDGFTANIQNPSHIYGNMSTTYTPTLTVTTGLGASVRGFGPTITTLAPSLTISATPTAGPSPLTVQFTIPSVDNYGFTITNWYWDFGDDNGIATNQNPVYQYNDSSSTYAPNVTVSDNNGNSFSVQGPNINLAPYNGVVLNGGFEAYTYFTGWTLTGDAVNCLVDYGGTSGLTPNSGSYLAALQTIFTSGQLSQNLATIPGSNYLLSFALNGPANNTPNSFRASWNGSSVFSGSNVVTSGWTNMQYFVTASSTNTLLQFSFNNENGYFGLDDVSATLTPGLNAVVTSPTNGSSFAIGQSVNITATAMSIHGIQSLALYTNGGLVLSAPAANILTTNLTGLPSGSYSAVAAVTDTNGNVSFSAPVNFTVNTPGTQLIDFDAVNATQGAVISPGLDNYLLQYGVTEGVNPGNGAPAIVNVANLQNGTLTTASSGSNILTTVGTNGVNSYTLYFANPCTKVSWVRTALLASGGGVVTPNWTAYAYDSFNNLLGQVGETQFTSSTNIPAATFFLEASNIASITFTADNSLSPFNSLPLDDLLLSTNAIAGATPSVNLNTNSFVPGAPGQIGLTARATEAGGAISRIDFYANQVFRGSTVNPTPGTPFVGSITLSNLPAGVYSNYAVATDTNGVTRASSIVTLTITNIPGVAVIDFDDPNFLDTSSGAVGGTNLSNYFAGFGVRLSHVTQGTRLEAVGQNSFTGANVPVPTSQPNLFRQVGSKLPVTFRLDFATNVQSVTFNRIGMNTNSRAHISHPAWTAEILNASGAELQEVSEPLLTSSSNIPPRTFTLTTGAANIASLKFSSDSQQIAAFGGVLLDDLVLNLPATNPLSIGLSVVGGGFQAPTNISFTVSATDTATNIDHVSYYSGPTLIGVSSNSPYSFTWTNVLNGTYHIKAQIVDVAGYAQFSSAVTVTVLPGGDILVVDFDSLNASAGNVSGAPLTSYLASNAMTIPANSTGSTVVVQNEANIAGGNAVTASSISNLLTQIGPNGPMSFTVNFSTLLSQFGFTRPTLLADPYVTHPAWKVRAFGPHGRLLDTAQEPVISSFTNVPAQPYTLNGPGIASVQFSSSGNSLSTFPAMLLDDFVINGALSVSVTNPADGQILTSLQVPIQTATVDTNGTVTNVSFYYNGTNLIGSDQSSPFSFNWTAPSNGSYILTAIGSDTAGLSSTSAPVSVVIASGFAILAPPVSQTLSVGSNATFSVTTTASNGVAYQWFANGSALSGQTGSALTLSNIQHSDAGLYMVVATANSQSISNDPPALLTVIDPPVVSAPLLTPASPNIGDTVTLQEFATPTNGPIPFTYQWQLNGASIPGATNSIYTISNAQPLNSGNYQVVVGDIVAFSQSPSFNVAVKFGTNAIPTTNTTFATSLAFNPLVGPVEGINSNSPGTGELAKIAGKKAGRFLWYNWTASFTGSITLATMGSSFDTLMGVYTGTNLASLSKVAEDDDSGGFFTSLISFNCAQGVTYQIAVAGYKGAAGTVVLGLPAVNGFRVLSAGSGNSLPIITQQPVNQIVNPGDTVSLGVVASNATSYQWFFAGAAVNGVNTNILVISNFPPTAVGNYYAQVANAVGSVQSATAAIQIAAQTNQGSSSTPDTISVDKFGDAVDLTTAAISRYRPADAGGDVGGFTLSQSFSTVGATKEENEPNHAGQPGGASYWYAYTALAGGTVQFDTAGSTFNTILAVYTGPGTGFSSLVNVGAAYTTNFLLTGQPVVLVSNVVSGTTFYIAVDGYLAASGAAHIDVVLNPPSNGINTNVPPITNNSVILTVTSPVNNYVTTAAGVDVKGTVRGNGKGLGQTVVNVALGTNPPAPAALGNAAATTSWILAGAALSPGPNLITAQAFSRNSDGTTNASLPVQRMVFSVPALPNAANKSAVTLLTSGRGKISGLANNASLEVNKVYKVTAVPSANWLFTNWTSGTGTNSLTPLPPNNPALTFVMSSNLVLQANFVTNPFTAVAGTYNGLFAATNGVAENSSGFFSATIPASSKGTYSAKLLLDGGTYPFSGSFDLSGDAGLAFNRPGKSPVIVELHLNLATPDDQITGNIIDGANPGWFSTLQADRAVFNARSNPATNFNGRYTFIVPPGTNAPTNSPGGFGYATLTNDPAGNAALVGKLGDGTAISQSVPISKDGYIPLFASLYSKQGSLIGWLAVTNIPSNAPPKTVLGSTLSWIKLPVKGHAAYAAGFTNTNITILGSFYVPPTKGSAVLPLLTNATLVISNGNLGTAMVYSNITFNGDKLVNPNTATPLSGTITPGTGVLTVTFRAAGVNHNTTASGVVLPSGAVTNAAGWFLGTSESGYFLLTQ